MHQDPVTSPVSISCSVLESLSYPDIARRCVEAVVGSTRRDALAIIRNSSLSNWEFMKDDTRSVAIRTTAGEVLFEYSSTLEAVHITTPRESKHFLGSCEMAQRLLRFAARAVEVLYARAESDCVRFVTEVLNGKVHPLNVSSAYEYLERDERDPDGGYNLGAVHRGKLATPFGELSLASESRKFLIGGERGREMEFRRQAVMHEILFRKIESPCNYPPVYSSPARPTEMFLPPSPHGEIDWAAATFQNRKLDSIRNLLGLPAYTTRIGVGRDVTRACLAWARAQQEKGGRASSDASDYPS